MIDITKDPKDIAEELKELHRPLANMWDCYYDCPLEDNNHVKSAIISVKIALLTTPEQTTVLNGDFYDNPDYTKWQQVLEILEKEIK